MLHINALPLNYTLCLTSSNIFPYLLLRLYASHATKPWSILSKCLFNLENNGRYRNSFDYALGIEHSSPVLWIVLRWITSYSAQAGSIFKTASDLTMVPLEWRFEGLFSVIPFAKEVCLAVSSKLQTNGMFNIEQSGK